MNKENVESRTQSRGVAKKYFNPKYAIDILLRAEIALKSATSLLFSISP
jgi:hypothetical protein